MVYGATLYYPPIQTLEVADYYFASLDGENWVCVNRLPDKSEDEKEIKALIEGEPYDQDADDGSWPFGYTLDEETNRVRPILFSTRYLNEDTRGTVEFHDPIES